MQNRITLEGVTKKYKDTVAVNDVSLAIGEPMIYGLIGRNGAGKTTLLKMIAGLANPTAGKVECVSDRGTGVLIEAPGIYGHLSAKDNLMIKMKMNGVADPGLADRLLARVGLSDVGRKKTGTFSLGMKQRLGIALALVGDPGILLLDEPINGLDPEGIILVRNLLKELAGEGKIVIVSSHMLEELSKIADRYGFLDRGRLLDEFDPARLEAEGGDWFILTVDRAEDAAAILARDGFSASAEDGVITVRENEKRASGALGVLIAEGIVIKEFKKRSLTLEDVFLSEGGDING